MSVWDTPTTTKKLDDRQVAGEVPFIGQNHIKVQVEPFMEEQSMPHVLLTGDPGMGKTQFAKWVAWQRGKPFFERIAPVKPESLPPYGILLLDEVHNQRRVESLFEAMDQGLLTFVAATTKPQLLDQAFRSRFLISVKMRRYSIDEMVEMMTLMLSGEGEPEHISVLAHAADGHPRTAEQIARTATALESTDPELVLRSVRITADGMTDDHFDYLTTLEAASKPLGVSQIATMVLSSSDDVQRLERGLILKGYVELTPSGRALTLRGKQYVRMLRDEGVIDG